MVTVGAYDGVHLGHRAVIAEVRDRARRHGLASAVVTFDRHPASVVRPASAPRLLTDLDQKLELLASTGIDLCLVVTFDEARSKEPAEDFVREVLVDCLRARQVVVGRDFHFGHDRAGDVGLLVAMGAELGFTAAGLDLVDEGGRAAGEGPKVSSTAIRRALVEGELAAADRMLGRHHEVRALVVRADAELTERGVATVDLAVPGDILVPAAGTYAVARVDVGGRAGAGRLLASVGRRPPLSAEAHVQLVELHGPAGAAEGDGVSLAFLSRLGPVVPAEPGPAAAALAALAGSPTTP